MYKFIKSILLSCILFCAMTITAQAYEITYDNPLSFKEAEGFYQSGTLVLPVGSDDYNAFESDLIDIIISDVNAGYLKVINLKNANSHIPLESTGNFLQHVIGKEVSEIGSNIPKIPVQNDAEDINIQFNGDRTTKAWLVSFCDEKLKPALKEFSDANPFEVYCVNTNGLKLLKDFNFDDYSSSDYIKVNTVYPLSGIGNDLDEIGIHNTGKNYSMQLNPTFAKIVNGSIDGTGAYTRLSATKALTNKVNIAYPYSNKADGEDMSVANLIVDKQLGVDLTTKELYDVTKQAVGLISDIGTYEDCKINQDNLAVITMHDGMAVVFINFIELFNFNNTKYSTETIVDMSDYYLGKDTVSIVVENNNPKDEPIASYLSSVGQFECGTTADTGEPTLLISKDALPLKRLLEWSTTDSCQLQMGDKGKDKLKEALKSQCEAKGELSTYKAVYGNDGLLAKLFVLIVLIVVIIGAVLLILRKKKKEAIVDTSFTDVVQDEPVVPMNNDSQDSNSDIIQPTPNVHNRNKIKGLAAKKKGEQVRNFTDTPNQLSVDNSITDDTGFTSFGFDEDDSGNNDTDFTFPD